jgi:hypothetical protein
MTGGVCDADHKCHRSFCLLIAFGDFIAKNLEFSPKGSAFLIGKLHHLSLDGRVGPNAGD